MELILLYIYLLLLTKLFSISCNAIHTSFNGILQRVIQMYRNRTNPRTVYLIYYYYISLDVHYVGVIYTCTLEAN